MTWIAGDRFEIHHNTFLQETFSAVKIRAVPQTAAYVHDNEFLEVDPDRAIRQQIDHLDGETWNENVLDYDNVFGVNHYPIWFVSYGAESFWTLRRFDDTSVVDVAFGDFDCDGRDDAFRATGSEFQYAPGKGLEIRVAGNRNAFAALGRVSGRLAVATQPLQLLGQHVADQCRQGPIAHVPMPSAAPRAWRAFSAASRALGISASLPAR